MKVMLKDSMCLMAETPLSATQMVWGTVSGVTACLNGLSAACFIAYGHTTLNTPDLV